jgi:sec-independent protein translocase protein TatC
MSQVDEVAEAESDVKMTIWEHLGELRSRVARAAIALGLGFAICWNFHERLLAWLLVPYEKAWFAKKFPGAPELQTLAPTDAFVGYMHLSLVGGIVFAIPIIFYQLWSFISPGLYQKEKKFVFPFVFFSSFLFASGVAFAYYVAFPFFISYMFSLLGQVSEAGTVLTQRPTLEYYLDFVTRMLLSFGFVFELPLFITFLSIAGIVTPKQLVGFSRWAILSAFILGAIITPGPEVTSQLLVSGALICLYFLSILLAYVFARKKPVPTDEEVLTAHKHED